MSSTKSVSLETKSLTLWFAREDCCTFAHVGDSLRGVASGANCLRLQELRLVSRVCTRGWVEVGVGRF